MEQRFQQDFSRVRVHTDAESAEAAGSVNAEAFTSGSSIVFASGQHKPDTSAGRWLLAHELAHVVQQSRGPAVLQALTLSPPTNASEREADTAANSVAAGGQAPSISADPATNGTLQRSLFGDIAGGAVGAAAGAGLGFLIGGPIGALVGGLIGGAAGLAAGDALSAEKRELTGPERTEAKIVFGENLDMGAVRVAEAPIMGIGQNARTPFDTIYFPPGTSKLAFIDFMPWLIHELTYAWQYQHGVGVIKKLFWALHGASAYDYGGEPGLVAAAAQGKRFKDFQTEQQGDICRDYYLRVKEKKDVSAWMPFIAEVQGKGSLGDSRSRVERKPVSPNHCDGRCGSMWRTHSSVSTSCRIEGNVSGPADLCRGSGDTARTSARAKGVRYAD